MWELRKGDLDSVFWMTWAEFCILSKGWERTERNSWFKVREISWNSLIGAHVDPKKLPKSKQKFMSINGEEAEKPKVNSKQIKMMREKIKKLNEQFNK